MSADRDLERARPRRGFLRVLTPVLKPLFASNHHWVFARGRESLERELARRRAMAATEEQP